MDVWERWVRWWRGRKAEGGGGTRSSGCSRTLREKNTHTQVLHTAVPRWFLYLFHGCTCSPLYIDTHPHTHTGPLCAWEVCWSAAAHWERVTVFYIYRATHRVMERRAGGWKSSGVSGSWVKSRGSDESFDHRRRTGVRRSKRKRERLATNKYLLLFLLSLHQVLLKFCFLLALFHANREIPFITFLKDLD